MMRIGIGLSKTAENIKKVMRRPPVRCPKCDESFFSIFDKTYLTVYGICYGCDPNTDPERANNIFKLTEDT